MQSSVMSTRSVKEFLMISSSLTAVRVRMIGIQAL